MVNSKLNHHLYITDYLEVTRMENSQATNLAGGFRNWSFSHPLDSSHDDHPVGATPSDLGSPELDEPIMAPPEHLHRPWLVRGFGTL
jgi:hypothetical protein